MIETNTQQPIQEYGTTWVSNPNFGIATAAILIIVMVSIIGFLLHKVINSMSTKIDAIQSDVTELQKDLVENTLLYKAAYNLKINGDSNGTKQSS